MDNVCRLIGLRPPRLGSGRCASLGLTIMWLVLALMTLWAIAALYVDFRIAALRIPVTVIYVLAIIAILIKVRPRLWARLCVWRASALC